MIITRPRVHTSVIITLIVEYIDGTDDHMSIT